MNKNQEIVQDEVLKKIGRNVLLFQKMEYMLKWIISVQDISGSASELTSNWQSRSNQISKQTLGKLVGNITEEINIETVSDETDDGMNGDITDIHISMKIQYEMVEHESWSNRLSALVTEQAD